MPYALCSLRLLPVPLATYDSRFAAFISLAPDALRNLTGGSIDVLFTTYDVE